MTNSVSNPVTFKGRRSVFDNSRFRVFADHIADTRGNEVEDYLVVVPRNEGRDLVTGVAVVPVQNDRILLVNVYRHAVQRRGLEIPRGFIDAGERPAQAAIRELTEETGFICAAENLQSLGMIQPEPGLVSARIAIFAAIDVRPGGESADDEIGVDEWDWVPVPVVAQKLRNCEIEEGTSCLALHRYLLLRQEASGSGK